MKHGFLWLSVIQFIVKQHTVIVAGEEDELSCRTVHQHKCNTEDGECNHYPWLAALRMNFTGIAGINSHCTGSIISKRYILTAASCFCATASQTTEEYECIQNDAVPSGKSRSGHYEYTGGTRGSRVDFGVKGRITVYIPGIFNHYRLNNLRDDFLAGSLSNQSEFQVEEVRIHPDYVYNKREHHDVALIKLSQEIEFMKGKVGPICLADKSVTDTKVPARIVGWGTLYDKVIVKKNNGDLEGWCVTDDFGPERGKKCRSYSFLEGEHLPGRCNSMEQPSNLNPVCKELMKQFSGVDDANKNITATVLDTDANKTITCYPFFTQWCSTCKEGVELGSPGYCLNDQQEIKKFTYDEYSYFSTVEAEESWGFCENRCDQNYNTMANEAKEKEMRILSLQECLDWTQNQTDYNYRPRVDRELCATRNQIQHITHYTYGKESGFKQMESENRTIQGGSETCWADTGSGLFGEQVDGSPVLLGIASRETNCTGPYSVLLFSRVAYLNDWIKDTIQEMNSADKQTD